MARQPSVYTRRCLDAHMSEPQRPITRSYARALLVEQLASRANDDDIEKTLTSRTDERQRADRYFVVAMLALLTLFFGVIAVESAMTKA